MQMALRHKSNLMFMHDKSFVRSVADGIRSESEKAGVYTTHMGELGTLREKALIGVLRDHTPRKFSVETGLVRDHQRRETSRQCDVLVHDDFEFSPLYRMEDFVIVPARAARCVVEVKSVLNSKEFQRANCVYDSLFPFSFSRSALPRPIPVFAYGLTGVTFTTFCHYVSNAAAENRLKRDDSSRHLNWLNGWFCLGRKYLAIRPTKGDVSYCLCVDFSKAGADASGVETGYFLAFYAQLLNQLVFNGIREELNATELMRWFNSLEVNENCKVWVKPDGMRCTGNIPNGNITG